MCRSEQSREAQSDDYSMLNRAIDLRPLAEEDYDLLYDIHRAAMRAYVEATWGWDEDAQERRFRDGFDPARVRVIRWREEDVGFVDVKEGPDVISLLRIEIAPAFQGNGIGTLLIGDILRAAAARNARVELRVMRVNPAKNLYERLGFVVTDESETHYMMRADPKTGPRCW
jgi:ribosomal protein S18 acetylase RimI-like enzyme